MMTEKNLTSWNEWWESEWYKKQQEMRKKELEKDPPQCIPRWIYSFDNNGELKFEYVNM